VTAGAAGPVDEPSPHAPSAARTAVTAMRRRITLSDIDRVLPGHAPGANPENSNWYA
jgi:hypothetical protein